MPTTSVIICSQPDVCTWTTCQILQSCWFKIFCSSRFIKSRYTVKCENIHHLLYHLHLIDYQNWIRKIIESDYICWTTWREVLVNMLRANWRHLLKLRCQILNKAWRRTNLHHSKDLQRILKTHIQFNQVHSDYIASSKLVQAKLIALMLGVTVSPFQKHWFFMTFPLWPKITHIHNLSALNQWQLQIVILLLVCVSLTIIGQPRNSVLIRRV